jgi:arylsulfatase A-like enzyme
VGVANLPAVLNRYYAVVTFMDSQFGRVMDYLESSGLDKTTIVTFIGVGD